MRMIIAGRDGEINVLKERLKVKIPQDRQVFYDALHTKEEEIVNLKMRLGDQDEDLSDLDHKALVEKEEELQRLKDQSMEMEHQIDIEAELQAKTERVNALEQQLTTLGMAELQTYKDNVQEKEEAIAALKQKLEGTGSVGLVSETRGHCIDTSLYWSFFKYVKLFSVRFNRDIYEH